jgi:hypothetical protein
LNILWRNTIHGKFCTGEKLLIIIYKKTLKSNTFRKPTITEVSDYFKCTQLICHRKSSHVRIFITFYHHHVHKGLGVFPVPWSSRWIWSLYLFLGRPLFLRPFGLHRSACFGTLFVSVLCTCNSHFSWYSFIFFTIFCAPVFSLIHWFFPLSSFVIPSKCLKYFICTASKRRSFIFFDTEASLSNFNAV